MNMRMIIPSSCVFIACLIASGVCLAMKHVTFLREEEERLDKESRELDKDLEQDENDWQEFKKENDWERFEDKLRKQRQHEDRESGPR